MTQGTIEAAPTAESKGTVTIRHTHAEGTLIIGSRKGDGVWEVIKPLRGPWWFSRNIGLYLKHSRDQIAKRYVIELAERALTEAGWTVTVEIDNDATRSVAEAEADRAERAENRADWHDGAADRAADASQAAYEASHRLVENIPFGQPVLVDHYSAKAHRRTLDRSWDLLGKSVKEGERSDYHAHRADAAASHMEHREDIPRTLRRIEKMEADARRIQRELDGRPDWIPDESAPSGYKVTLVKPGPRRTEDLTLRLRDVNAQITYWKEHVAKAEENGVKVWGPSDFKKGDFVHGRWGWAEVLRVNPKSLTIPWGSNAVHLDVVTRDNVTDAIGGKGWRDKVTYDDARGRKSAEEMAEMLAEKTENKEI